jgi:hypothetical protein
VTQLIFLYALTQASKSSDYSKMRLDWTPGDLQAAEYSDFILVLRPAFP